MPFPLSDNQTKAVLEKDSAKRHRYFVRKTVDWQQLWGAKKGDEWLVPQSSDKVDYFPVWPHPKCAEQALADHFPGYEAIEITLLELLDYWLPLFSQHKVRPAIFPNDKWAYASIEPEKLSRQLKNELAKYG